MSAAPKGNEPMMVSGGEERKWASGGDAWFSIEGLMVVMMGFGSVLKMTVGQFQRMKDGSEQVVRCKQADNSREVRCSGQRRSGRKTRRRGRKLCQTKILGGRSGRLTPCHSPSFPISHGCRLLLIPSWCSP
jgi:hypothetical protein